MASTKKRRTVIRSTYQKKKREKEMKERRPTRLKVGTCPESYLDEVAGIPAKD